MPRALFDPESWPRVSFSPFRHGPRLISTCIFQTVTCIDILGLFGPRSCNVRLLWRYWVHSMMALFECLRMCCAHNVVARCSPLELWLIWFEFPEGKHLSILGVVQLVWIFPFTRSFICFLNSLPRFSTIFSESSFSLCYALSDINHVTACRNPSHIDKEVPSSSLVRHLSRCLFGIVVSKTDLQRNFWGHYNNRQENTLGFPTGSRQDALRPELNSDRETVRRLRLDLRGCSLPRDR